MMTIHDTKKDEKKENKKEGTLRLLTPGEIKLAKSVFMSTIPYNKVWIHCDSYLPFGFQDNHTAMSPNGEIYFRPPLYHKDFSQSVDDFQHLFIHEMSHVWQRGHGMNVIARGLGSWLVSYRYTLDGRLLSEYPMEQQAQIIADQFVLDNCGYYLWNRLRQGKEPVITCDDNIPEVIIREKYKHCLRGVPW